MDSRKRYRKRAGQAVTAVQLNLQTSGFTYDKWGGVQTCKPGDWIVDNEGEIYSVDSASFAQTYQEVGPGRFVKIGTVWAEVAASAGEIRTKEGLTRYNPGDFLVFNNPDGSDGYSMTAERFHALYEEINE